MPLCALGISPIITSLVKDNTDIKMLAFADDFTGAGNIK